ncbi:hypothetical protein [Neptuniibacter sp. CAU 1671]|uniref:hypothetical protein n=1 Tax=Neptuniibacter sp. CAU 1671 TaxID=3032593 RepID=UPI0023DA2BF4|nr:hypothetical protein [Neptuniibacter sp. CAU 1671]MDF2180977.1 hypothetical protein [Neptuniibacter sp. CAU 1671]
MRQSILFGEDNVDPLIIFLATGMVTMSAALSAGAINKLPEDQKPSFASTRNGMVAVIMAGNISAITLLFAMAYGFLKLDWWIPLICMFISFPVVHVLVIQRVLGDLKALVLMLPLVIAAMPVLYYYW